MNSKEEFVTGKHSIIWVDFEFEENFPNIEFESVSYPVPQTLTERMSDARIESELKPGMCTLGDVLAFLDNAPEECKDGYANLFYFHQCVVGVYWSSGGRGWDVSTWQRGGRGWGAGGRVFSPATGLSGTKNSSESQ